MSEAEVPRAHFRVCSTCRAPIPFGEPYYRCSVSTCNRSRMALYFCSVPCWEAHVPAMRHRDAWAEEARAPSRAEWEAMERAESLAQDLRTTRRIERPTGGIPAPRPAASPPDGARAPKLLTEDLPEDILVVVSKLKAYVKARGDLKTSDAVMPLLSDILRQVCDEAILRAQEAGRQTLLDRDLPHRWRPVD